jgi:hypothetical protein
MKRTLGLVLICCAAAACSTGDASNPGAASAGDKGTVVELDGLKSTAPANWKEEVPKGNLRMAQFRLPKVDGDPGDAELVIFFFGKGSGGSTADNLKRWKDKFVAPEGKKSDDLAKVDKFKVGNVDIVYADIKGTFLYKNPPFDPNAKTERRPDYRMLGVIFESPNGPYFITLTGPGRTIEQHKKAFDEWLKNFK